MAFRLPKLPYPKNALAPHISAETLDFHHGKHHAKYVKTLNELVEGTKLADEPLEELIRGAKPGKLFNNAAQHWNHGFYWQCLSPDGGDDPTPKVRQLIETSFESVDGFRKKIAEAAEEVFGSGWAWLVRESNGRLAVVKTANAENPLTQPGRTALLTCDMWEHAYYLDYRNAKERYLDAFWHVVNWEFVASSLEECERSADRAA